MDAKSFLLPTPGNIVSIFCLFVCLVSFFVFVCSFVVVVVVLGWVVFSCFFVVVLFLVFLFCFVLFLVFFVHWKHRHAFHVISFWLEEREHRELSAAIFEFASDFLPRACLCFKCNEQSYLQTPVPFQTLNKLGALALIFVSLLVVFRISISISIIIVRVVVVVVSLSFLSTFMTLLLLLLRYSSFSVKISSFFLFFV